MTWMASGLSDRPAALTDDPIHEFRLSTLDEPTKSATKRGRRALVDFLRRADLLHLAVVEHRDAVGHRQRLALVVRDEDEVMPSAFCSDFSSSCIDSRSLRSSAPSGSSSSRTFGC